MRITPLYFPVSLVPGSIVKAAGPGLISVDEHSGFQTYSWAVAFANYNSSLTPVFYFRINNINNDSQTFSSHYFNVSGNSSPSNALSGVTSTLLPAAPTTTITGQSSTSTPTTQATVSSAPQSAGLSSGAKAGIGVGAAVAIIVIVSLLGALVWSRHKIALHAAHTQETGPYTQENKITPNAVGSFDSRLPGYFEAPVEMEETKTWNRHPQELQS